MVSGNRSAAAQKRAAAQPALRPPGTRPDGQTAEGSAGRRFWLAFALLAALGLAIVFLLPDLVSQPDKRPESTAVPSAEPSVPATVVDTAAARARAEQALQDFLELQAELELVDAPGWGEPDWSRAVAEAAAGDRLFAERRFPEALSRYSAARQQLQALAEQRPRRLARALEDAWKALQADQSALAREKFEAVLAMEPDHAGAASGLLRAQHRPDVLQQMEAGQQAEAAGKLEMAQNAYQQALQLDAAYTPATEGLARVEGRLAERGFRTAMSEALASLEAGRFEAAEAALARAAAIRPDDATVNDTRRRLAEVRRQARLARLRREASRQAGKENWARAARLYRQALAIDAQAAFAREGREKAETRARLHEQFDHYLDDPDRLYSPQPLANAEKLLAAAGEPPASEPRLAAKARALQRLVALAREPLTVTLKSDGETDVVIYHVGRLGRFLERRQALLPGTYTVVGSRAGYRDVRRVFSVRPGKPPPTLLIRCEEPV